MDNQPNSQLSDLTEGLSFFKWMTQSFMDKIYMFVLNPVLIAILIFLLQYHGDGFSDEDLWFAYGTDVFFGMITAVIMQNSFYSNTVRFFILPVIVANILAAITFFFGWQGWTIGFDLFILSMYWGGYYLVYKKNQKGFST